MIQRYVSIVAIGIVVDFLHLYPTLRLKVSTLTLDKARLYYSTADLLKCSPHQFRLILNSYNYMLRVYIVEMVLRVKLGAFDIVDYKSNV
jgi:hypothetical protein